MKKIYLFVLAVLATVTTWSQKTWEGPTVGGSWTEPSNWSGNTVPVSSDVVVFGTGISGTITNVPNMSIAGLIIEAGNVTLSKSGTGINTLTITNGAAAVDFSVDPGATLTLNTGVNIRLNNGTAINRTTASIAGALTLSNREYNTGGTNVITNVLGTGSVQVSGDGAIVSNAATKLAFESGATYFHARNGGNIPIATWADGSKTNITGITDAAPGGLTGAQLFGDFEWSSSQIADIDLNGDLRNVKGNLVISRTSGDATPHALILTSAASRTLSVGGDLIIDETGPGSTNVYLTSGGNGNMTLSVAGNYHHDGGMVVFAYPLADADAGIGTIGLAGNLVQTGGLIDFTSGADETSGNTGIKGRLLIQGDLTQTGGEIQTTTSNPEITNGTISFVGDTVQTYTATTPTDITYTNYVVAAGTTLKLASGLRITRDSLSTRPNWVGRLTVVSGGTLDASTFVIQSQILPDLAIPDGAFANFILAAGAKLITANANGVEGSIDTTDQLLANLNSGADYEFQGASTGAFQTRPTASTARNFIVNRAGGPVTLDMPITVMGQLGLTAGLLTTTTTNLLTIGAGGSATPATETSFVNGPLAKTGITAFTFPVGKSGAGFRNIGISAPSANSTFRAEFFNVEPPSGTLESPLVRVSTCEYWDLSRTAGSGAARVVLSWEPGSNCGTDYVTDPTTLRVAHLMSGVWLDEGRLSTTGDNSAGTITSGDIVSSFSPFALASSSAASNPLPVVFGNVRAYEKNNGVQVEWSNLTEKDVAGYTIERSSNGTDFAAIGQQLPTSNQDDRADYSFFDANPGVGTNFYRIRAEETTGKIVYSSILSVNLNGSGESLRLYPNPVTNNQVTVTLSNIKRGLYTLRVVNTAGQDVFRQVISSQGQGLTQNLSLPSVKPGTYYMVITGDGYRENKKFIVQ